MKWRDVVGNGRRSVLEIDVWPFDVLTQLRTLTALVREQNGLLRELIQFHTRRPAQTPLAPETPPLRPPTRITPRTDKDVFVMTPAAYEEQAIKELYKTMAPWRFENNRYSSPSADDAPAAPTSAPASAPPSPENP